MISKIDSITNFGIYKKYEWDSATGIKNFNEKNIFYGWNYSGKTTFSRIFSSLRDRSVYSDYNTGNFKIVTKDGNEFSKENIDLFPYNILVFNSDYVKENLRLDNKGDVNAIFFEVGESAKISTQIEALEKLILDIEGSDTIIGKKKKYEKDILKFETFEKSLFTVEARKIKDENFRSLINFTKADLKKIRDYIIKDIESQIIFDKKNLERTSVIIKLENPKPLLINVLISLNYHIIKVEVDKILIEAPSRTDIIEILDKKQDAYNWAKVGFELHRVEKKCLFCNNDISENRFEKLKLFFESQSSILRTKCKDAAELLAAEVRSLDEIVFPNSHNDFNEGFQNGYIEAKKIAEKAINSYKSHLYSLIKKVKEKSDVNTYSKVPTIKDFNLDQLLNSIGEINTIIERNNVFSGKFDEIVAYERDRYKNHLVACFLKESKYISIEKKAKRATLEVEKLNLKINEYRKRITYLNNLRESDSVGCVKFEAFIQDFLGKDDISISLNENTGKFNLLRGLDIATNLSEGEKMAISFSHFLVTIESIKEKNNFADYILFIDDPISSLDGNHIFQIHSLLKDVLFEFIGKGKYKLRCKQLFISTHNYDFFNLLKELPNGKGKFQNESHYYISRKVNNASIEKLPYVYEQFESEYHYLFNEIMSFNLSPNKDSHPSLLLMPNILRRFLEIYTISQYPTKDGLDSRADVIFGRKISKRICKPFHYFSHFSNIDRISKQSEFLVDVGKACEELINFFEGKNDIHYQALKESIK